jgi:hypothetical protein
MTRYKTRSATYKTALTHNQELFCLEYVKDYNQVQAATRAGYSENGIDVIASRTIRRPLVLARIAELEAAKAPIELSVSKIDSMYVVLNDEPNQQKIKDITKRLTIQEGLLLWGVLNNSGILTRSAISKFHCTNIPTVSKRINDKIEQYGLEISCKPQKAANSRRKQHEWYLCS